MTFRSIIRDARDSLGRCSFDVRLTGSQRGKSHGAVHDLLDLPVTIEQSCWADLPQSCWADLPPELLHDIIKRLEASESTWPSRKHVVACAAVCRAWRETCKEIVKIPEFCGKLTFPASLKQPGPRDRPIQCFIRRDKSNLTYRLYLCLSPDVFGENGKFLLSARKSLRTVCPEYIISMDADNISRSSSSYIGKLRSNWLRMKFTVFEGSYSVAEVIYELDDLGTVGTRRVRCLMHSIPVSSLEPGGTVPGLPVVGNNEESKDQPLVLHHKVPRWNAQQLRRYINNYKRRVKVASVKNFQLIAAPTPSQPGPPDPDNVILLFGKVSKDMFTMDYRYPLSAFQAFAICLSTFDPKLGDELGHQSRW